MCGIAGLVGTSDPASTRSALLAMARSMVHRGPDDEGIETAVAGNTIVGLCARRLAIQDCSPRGHQPMRSSATGNVLAFNGEIYNVESLRAELSAGGHRFQGLSDTEVALRAYDEWGPRCLDRVRGMFALAVWDARHRRLMLARDRLGIKPLYFLEDGEQLRFASEIRTLLASGIEARISPQGVTTYLALGSLQDPNTMLDGVRSLPAGHVATWTKSGLTVERYWSLDDVFREPQYQERDEAVADLRELLEEAVRIHLISDVPLGVFLSGGIDSSALVGLVSQVSSRTPKTLSVVFPQQRFSEDPHMQLVARRFGTDHTAVEVDDAAILAEVPEAVAALDQPSFDGVNTFIVSRLARSVGLTVCLSGLGGDELFGGYDSFQVIPRLNRLRRLLPAPAGRVLAAAVERVGPGTDTYKKLERWLRADEPEVHGYALRRELFGPADSKRIMPIAQSQDRGFRNGGLTSDELNDISRQELSVYMGNMLLRDVDVMSMAHSLEVRVPFLDHRVVEAAGRMPGRWKHPARSPKPLLVDAVHDLLPREIVHRKKMGFTLPFSQWLRGSLRDDVEAVLLDREAGGQVAHLLDPRAVEGVWRAFLDDKLQWHRAWALYTLKVWGERHLGSGRTVPA